MAGRKIVVEIELQEKEDEYPTVAKVTVDGKEVKGERDSIARNTFHCWSIAPIAYDITLDVVQWDA